MAPELRRCQRCCVWKKPPVGAVLGHVAQRNGAVFLSDPSMKKKYRASGRRAGGCTTAQRKQLHRRKTRNADAAEHGVSPPLRNKPSER
ncbi:hypothetical protein ABVT39_015459 [Epinephelus coioides]